MGPRPRGLAISGPTFLLTKHPPSNLAVWLTNTSFDVETAVTNVEKDMITTVERAAKYVEGYRKYRKETTAMFTQDISVKEAGPRLNQVGTDKDNNAPTAACFHAFLVSLVRMVETSPIGGKP
ncbi:hypothetical protein Bbelb_225840 [Branchiostoma belcheri]|nr:hypothetical protein Bbelb_225840 [Branchiostoma belcheri]